MLPSLGPVARLVVARWPPERAPIIKKKKTGQNKAPLQTARGIISHHISASPAFLINERPLSPPPSLKVSLINCLSILLTLIGALQWLRFLKAQPSAALVNKAKMTLMALFYFRFFSPDSDAVDCIGPA